MSSIPCELADQEGLAVAAREWCQNYRLRCAHAGLDRAPASASRARYRKDAARLFCRARHTSGSIADLAAQGSRASFRRYRSAFFWCAYEALDCLQARRSDWSRARGLRLMRWLEGARGFAIRRQLAVRAHPRRLMIEALPPDWREMLALRLPHRARKAFLVCALTGCRPSELVQGISVSLRESRDLQLLELGVSGAKLSGRSGQPWRILAWRLHAHPLTSLLFECLDPDDGSVQVVQSARAQWLGENIQRVARRLWPGQTLSAYALRYQLACDLNSAGHNRIDIACALGHCNDASQAYYCTTRGGGRCLDVPERALVAVDATRRVRERYRERRRERAHRISFAALH